MFSAFEFNTLTNLFHNYICKPKLPFDGNNEAMVEVRPVKKPVKGNQRQSIRVSGENQYDVH